jgi:predicted transcriptional regulator
VETRVVTAHLPIDLADKLDGLAERLDRPKGWIVKEAIAPYVALERQPTLPRGRRKSAGL